MGIKCSNEKGNRESGGIKEKREEKRIERELSVVVHACNLSIREANARRLFQV